MRLRELELDEFRSFRKLRLQIAPAGFRAIGPNGSGKSTLLESIAMLATTRSPRTASEREIANWASGSELQVPPYARARGAIERRDGRTTVEIGMTLDERGGGALRKHVRIDDRPVRAIDAVGHVKTVLFSPEDVDLISGAPSRRRRYLDMAIGQGSSGYLRALSTYGRVLEQRNSLLRSLAREHVPPGSSRATQELTFWDEALTAAAVDVLAFRVGSMRNLSNRARSHYARLTNDNSLCLTYTSPRVRLPESDVELPDWRSPPDPVRQMLAAAFAHALEGSRIEDLRRGVTTVGPHRDDLLVTAGGADLGRFGSRGQQRLAVISIKLGELDLLEDTAGEPPVLLLDDVLSELDATHRENIVGTLASSDAQICITATDGVELRTSALGDLPLIQVQAGSIAPGDFA